MPRLDRPFTSTQTSTQTPPPLLAVLGLGVLAACAGVSSPSSGFNFIGFL